MPKRPAVPPPIASRRVPSAPNVKATMEEMLDDLGPTLLRDNILQKLLSIRPTDREGVLAVIRENPFIAGRLLSVANSAAMGVSNEVRTIEHAITLVGTRRARSLALASGMRSFGWKLGLARPVQDALLNNSLQRAILAKRFCDVIDPDRSDEAYVAALVLDLGLPVLLSRDQTPYAALLTAGGRSDSLVRDECLFFGIDHGIVSAALLARWNVASSVQSLVIQHHVAPDQGELFDQDGTGAAGGAQPLKVCSVRLATFFAGLLPHIFESATAWQSSWMRAMHHMFLGKHYESLDALLLAVGAEASASMSSDEAVPLDPKELTARLVEELSCDTELMVSNLCQMEQMLTAAREGSRDLKFQAFTDSLTKLLNRNGFLSLGQRRLAVAGPSHPVACMLCDLDGFKAINDRHGHSAGDQALRGFAKMLRAACPREAVIGRLGGDEFAILLVGVDAATAAAVAERVERQTRTHALRVSQELTLNLSASVGGFHMNACEPETEMATLLKAADSIMYERKRNGKAGVSFKSLDKTLQAA